jgi:tripartite-type tricarboxylate transporter receptor subunit TctC
MRIVVPAAPGGTTDIVARLLASHLAGGLGPVLRGRQQVGRRRRDRLERGREVGARRLQRLMGNIGPQSIAYSLYRNMPYQPSSLQPVSAVLTAPNVLVVHPSVPAKSVPEFVAWLKAQNGKASYASSGTGQSPISRVPGSCNSPGPRPSTCPIAARRRRSTT